MRDFIIINGKKSTDINGLLIQQLPPITKPLLRTEIEEIDGRDGDIVTPLGYSAYNKTISIGLYGDYDINEVISYFAQSGTVTFSNEPDKYYKFQILEQIDFEKLIRFKTATVTLHCQPFKKSLVDTPLEFTFSTITQKGLKIKCNVEGSQVTDFRIYGNLQQSGTPTTATPIPIQAVTGKNNIVFNNDEQNYTYSYNLGLLKLLGYSNYQDFIYKSGNKWYVSKRIGELQVNVDSITAITNTNIVYAAIPKPSNALGYNTTDAIQVVCNNASFAIIPSDWDTADAKDNIYSQGNATNYWIGFEAGTTLSDIKTALANCIIYYPLKNQIVAQITDTDLIAQLNSVYDLQALSGLVIAQSTQFLKAQPIYYVTFSNQAVKVENMGNYKAKPTIQLFGSGTLKILLNGNEAFTVDMSVSNLIIDTDKMEAYNAQGLKNRLVSGNYENFRLNIGINTISVLGNCNKIIVSDYSLWL